MRFLISTIAIVIVVAVSIILVNQWRIDQLIIKENKKFMTDYLKTADGVNIAYNLYGAKNPKGWLVLVHMMPATKESWQEFAKTAQQLGYESIAIDLRGHGQSDGGPNDYQKFSDAEHQASINDLEGAWKFLESRGAKPEKTAVIGASIGANLAIQFLTQHLEVSSGAFLSPGDYRGLDSGALVKKLSPNQKVVFAASRKDGRAAGNNAAQNQEYYNLAPAKNKRLILFDQLGHGTELLDLKNEFDLTGAIMKFLDHGSIN